MKPLLLYTLLMCAIGLAVLVQPSTRNRALAAGTLLAGALALAAPMQLAWAIAAPAVLLALWGLWRVVFWPLYWLEHLLRR
ncbi:hypothetical protein MASR1M59_00390 [Melaminivora sp.]